MPAQRQFSISALSATKVSVRLGAPSSSSIARHGHAAAGTGAVLAAHGLVQRVAVGRSVRSERSTLSFSSRTESAAIEVGGSMATRQSSCSMWFCTMSRSAPDLS